MFTSAEFKRRRKQLMSRIGKHSLAIVSAAPEKLRNRDADYAYRPDSDFYYLTGFSEPEAILVLIPGRAEGQYVLFCREKNPELETWTGRRVGVKAAPKNLEVDEAYPIHKADEIIPQLMQDRQQVYVSFGNDQDFDTRMIKWINGVRKLARSGVHAPQHLISLESELHEMRLRKSPAETRVMHKAAKISAEAHRRAMKVCKPNMFEYEVEAELLHVFRKHGCETAYNSIVGGGDNGCILHYVENRSPLHDGDLLLIDAGAELNYYASDITRTFPVNGRFSPEQRQLYQLVLDANLAAIKQVRPGNHWNKPHEAAVRVLTEGLIKLKLLKGKLEKLIEKEAYRKFYMHRTGHWLGMDVHDVGEYRVDGKWRKLEPGMVLTVEPGLYIAKGTSGISKKWWGIGIRIEDDVLVMPKGNKVLSADVPKEIDEIEALMAR